MKSKKKGIIDLYKSKITVFSLKDIALLLQDDNFDNLKARVKYFVDQGYLIRKRRGIYVKEDFNKFELATRIYTPAYISFETVLLQAGVTFQYYERIFVASYLSRSIKLNDGMIVEYRKLKDEILLNDAGIVRKENFYIATKERAFLDRLYISPDYYYDNLSGIDFDECRRIVKIYNNKSMIRNLEKYAQLAKT